MSLQAVSSIFTSQSGVAASFNAMSAGDPFCATHGFGPCVCGGGYTDLTNVKIYPGGVGTGTGDTLTVSTWTCPNCGSVVPQGVYHMCGYASPGIGTSPCVPNIFPSIDLSKFECAICDKMLEPEDKKLCKECRGIFEAWKFLTKKPEEEPEGGSEV